MGDAENALPPSKKRAAGREISRDNPGLDDDEDSSEQENGTFKRASDEVLVNRRIVKVRRNQTTATASSNPFSGIRLVPPAEPTISPAAPSGPPEYQATTAEDTTEAAIVDQKEGSEDGKNDVNKSEKNEEGNNQQSKKTDEKDQENTDDKGSAVVNEETREEANDEKSAGDAKTKDVDKKDDETGNADNEGKSSKNTDATAEGASLSSFQLLSSSPNAFTGLTGTGFSTSSFSFGSISKDGSTSSVPLFGLRHDKPFGFGLSTNGNSSSLLNAFGTSVVSKREESGFQAMPEVPVETGEENEKVVFSAESVLFEFIDGAWKERGKGELKVNVSTAGTEGARVLMRARGNYRLILNARLYPDMKLTNMDKRGITFACMNSKGEEKEGLSTFALKFKDASIVEEFRAAATAHKGNTAVVLKTPENTAKASED
ncbi:nuclear pore complex protein NUP50A-like isoform X2 [Hibiscus syriacus]|uniref:nuclear pore complex protein NUP50A-like isoform X2 n=1 Tax=Hibiscus syriacus TaxID=106335 RepID=UPI00192474D5|nr:nuclear pore complex protein NUP50A-like isoform X2 [Hibiscus syriacus]